MATRYSEQEVVGLVLDLLERKGVMSAKTIGSILGIDKSSLYPVLFGLIEAGELDHAMRDGYRLFVCRASTTSGIKIALAILDEEST